MLRLAVEGAEVVLLQELPAWALRHVAGWAGRPALTDVAQRPALGPVPLTASLGRLLTLPAPHVLRSAFTGQGNAIVLDPALRVLERHVIELNPWSFRRGEARRLGLDLVERLAWAKERRICQVARLARPDGATVVVANLHATSLPDRRVPLAETTRAIERVRSLARPGEPVVIGGDFNVEREGSIGIDHVVVLGAPAGPPTAWPPERRVRHGQLLSDHAPVELTVQL
jgi:hypothetical protein